MRVTLLFTRAAQGDRERLAHFLAQHSEEAADRAIEAIARGLEQIADFPMSGREVSAHFREWIVRFGAGAYVIRYRVEADRAVIVRIFHSREAR